ncbi:MAG: hypothetical protein M1571_06210 [Firmicutes bacterium]|nr:hypothetical protein [Bacillota bacterium]
MQNPLFWAGYIQEVIIPHCEHLEKAFFEKVLPAFEAVESEAEQISNEKWERLIRRTGTTIMFESSGGQVDKVAHLPELRFALGEPEGGHDLGG